MGLLLATPGRTQVGESAAGKEVGTGQRTETKGQRASRLMKAGQAALNRGPEGYLEARKHYEATVALGNTYGRPLAYVQLAAIERLRGVPAAGLELLESARRYLRPMDPSIPYVRRIQRSLLHESASCSIAMGLPDLAAGHARELFEASRDSARWRLRATLLDLDICLGRGDWSATKSRAKKARRDAEMLAALPGAGAEIELRELLARRESPREPGELGQVAERLAELATVDGLDYRRRFRALTTAIDAWLQIGDHERALARLRDESSLVTASAGRRAELLALRARAELAADATFRDRDDLQQAVAGRLAAWRVAPIRPGGSGPLHFEANRASLTTLSVLAGANATFSECAFAYDTLEAALAVGTLSRRLGDGPASLQDANSLAPRDGGILLFVFGPYLGSILTIERSSIAHHTVRLDRELWRQAKAYRAAIEQPPATADKRADAVSALRRRGEALAARLLPASARDAIAGWRSILLVGPEPTARLLHSLPYRNGWLCTEKAVSHVSSVALGLALGNRMAARLTVTKERARSRSLDLVVLGDPIVDAASTARWFVETLALPESRRSQFTAGFDRTRVRARWGDAARRSELADPTTQEARALAVFTHGVRDYVRERSAGFLLAAEEPGCAKALFADDVEHLRVPPLVLLGVCGASAGPLRMGDDGNHHLGGAFLMAGAEHVALGHGELSVGATRDLLCAMLAHWRAGEPPAEALRRARVAIASAASRAHPYFFAGLRLIGLPD